ncbi:hypothetical protein PSN45_002179 [Yamadazyma tenuis]|uniref:Solute carrier family 66 member 3 n=1 Tax=Candida tenuis (strain ATCC 10573 / BCRC 21748 / CBS 615 / JCM 9827 / NBRC 10315 / NRRL Y-1498 / VKM Y-70) TaxID=590646 RepID=G3BBU7_CANTC|nr:mannose-P-dolichol utilization defect 1 protein [Yamadazyma tenuis ATCC 10573]EGV60083.1 mannose-P-dolichol utilization defect 1 protein [Yamadazyma tenuis ATCC 10573]WEJ94685.1 hypothetical protein PSN45_002179 [Yamadazyma tenuis]
MGPPILQLLKTLIDPRVSKKMILQMAYGQLKMVGLAKVLSLLLSSSIVGVSSIIKIPQIRKIINPRLLDQRISVAQGLSLEGISLESFNYLIHVIYNQQNNNPFVGYGEALLLGLQNIAIILLIEYYKARSKLRVTDLAEKEQINEAVAQLARPVAIVIGAVVLLAKVLPSSAISGLQLLSIPFSIASKIPQIKRNHDLKSTTHLASVTINANVLGSLIRVFTTVSNFDKLGRDYILLAGYTSSFALNAVLAGQCYIYGKADKKSE